MLHDAYRQMLDVKSNIVTQDSEYVIEKIHETSLQILAHLINLSFQIVFRAFRITKALLPMRRQFEFK